MQQMTILFTKVEFPSFAVWHIKEMVAGAGITFGSNKVAYPTATE